MMKKMIGVVAALAAVFLMAGCSASPVQVPDGQLACADALDEIQTASKSYGLAMGKVFEDPNAAATEFDALAKKLKTASTTVNNKKISDAFTEMSAAATQLAAEMRKTHGDVTRIGDTDFDAVGDRFTKAMTTISDVCNS